MSIELKSIKNRLWNQDRKEFLIVFGVMMIVMLPARLLMVEYVSENWWGSFGAISAIAILMVVLVKKHKLGLFGEMFERQMLKLHQKGLRQKFVFGNMIFVLFVTGLLIFSVNAGNTTYLDQKNEIIDQAGGQQALEEKLGNVEQMYEKITPEQILTALILIPYLLIVEFGYFAGLWAIENDYTNGFLLHLSTVAFVETLEFFGVLMFYRFTLRKNNHA